MWNVFNFRSFILIALPMLGAAVACRPAVDDNGSGGDSASSDVTDGAITTAKIKDGAVTPAKLSQAYLPLAGGTMTGAINMGGQGLSNLATPAGSSDAVTKGYADGYLGGSSISGLSSISNGQVLSWDSANSRWSPTSVTGGAAATSIASGGKAVDSTATTTTPTNGYALVYNSAVANQWAAGVVSVAGGGTGATTLTSNGVLYGNGTGAVQAAAAMTNGQLLIGQTGAAPAPTTMTGDVTITSAGVTAIGSSKIGAAMVTDGVLTDTKMSGIGANCSSGQILKTNGSGGFYCGSPQAIRVTQTAHGFAVGKVIYNNSGTFATALSTNLTTGGAYVVSAVIDANNFEMIQAGLVTGLAGLTAGTRYYVSAGTAGALTSTQPTSGYTAPLLIADTTTSGYVQPYSPAQIQYAYLREEQTNGTNGGSAAGTVQQTRVLNTKVVDEIGITLAANQFTLPAGKYRIFASAPYYQADRLRCRIYNITDSATTLLGGSGHYTHNIGYASAAPQVRGQFTISASKVFELQCYALNGAATNGLGVYAGSGETEVYAEVEIWKLPQ